MKDIFFDAQNCQRCRDSLKGKARILSWFNDQTICMPCSNKEMEIKKDLPNFGRDHEGCGYVPEIKE